MKYSIALTAIALAVGLSGQVHAAEYKEGKDYKVITNPDIIKNDVIIVREFFWYGCSHCYTLEPFMEKWKKTKPEDVAFFQTPAAMNPVWENSARGFYTAQMMGYQDKTHKNLFDAVFKSARANQDIAGSNKQAITNWYASQGLDKARFESMLNSFPVNTKVARSNAAARRYKLTGTPAVVVQGKYIVSVEGAKVPKVIDYLVNKVRKENKK